MFPRKRLRLATDHLTDDQLIGLFATREIGLAVQPDIHPLLWDSGENGLSGSGSGNDRDAPKQYQVFHVYSVNGENPYQVSWSRAYQGISQIKINRVTFPISFLLFNTDQTLLYQAQDGSPVNFVVPYGNYSYTELKAWFDRESAFALKLSKTAAGQAVLHMRTVAGATRFSVSFAGAPQLQKALGYDAPTYAYSDCDLFTISRQNGISVDGYSLTSESLINLSLPPFVYLQASNSTTAMTTDGIETGNNPINNIIATIPLNANTGMIVNWVNPSMDYYDCSTRREYLFDTFTFLDPVGSILSFQTPWTIEIGCQMLIPYSGSTMLSRFSRTDFGQPPPQVPAVFAPEPQLPDIEEEDMFYDPPVTVDPAVRETVDPAEDPSQ